MQQQVMRSLGRTFCGPAPNDGYFILGLTVIIMLCDVTHLELPNLECT